MFKGLIVTVFVFSVPLGSIPELPAETCDEIKRSEEQAVSGKYWFSTIKTGTSVLAYCNMETNGEFSHNIRLIEASNLENQGFKVQGGDKGWMTGWVVVKRSGGTFHFQLFSCRRKFWICLKGSLSWGIASMEYFFG